MARWSTQEYNKVKEIINRYKDTNLSRVINVILDETGRTCYQSTLHKVVMDKGLNELRLKNRLYKRGEKEKIDLINGTFKNKYYFLNKKVELNKKYLLTEISEETRGGKIYEKKKGRLISYNEKFIIMEYENYKSCYLWNCYGIDWKLRGVKK